jgi:thioredoxin
LCLICKNSDIKAIYRKKSTTFVKILKHLKMRNKLRNIFLTAFLGIAVMAAGCNSNGNDANQSSADQGSSSDVKPVKINHQEFIELVYNYEANPDEWVFEGDLPVIVDFYADWCAPCRIVAPILDELAEEYAGKIRIYKVDTDKEKELARVFNIRSIPTMLFIPAEGRPQLSQGALPKETFKQVIDNFLLAE